MKKLLTIVIGCLALNYVYGSSGKRQEVDQKIQEIDREIQFVETLMQKGKADKISKVIIKA